MRASAIRARLLAASAICTITATPAVAQDYGLQSSDSTPISNPSGTTLQGARSGVFSTGPSLTLDNAGTIRGNGSNNTTNVADGGVIFSGGPGSITNSGSISGARVGIATTPFNNNGTFEGRAIGSTVTNSGSIIGDNGAGIRLVGGGSVTNSGYIAGRVGPGADGIAMFAYNGQNTSGMTGIGSVTNLAGGLIEGNRFGVFLIGGGSVDNAGTINHTVSVQGTVLATPGKFGSVTNSGTILNGGISVSLLEGATVNNSGLTGTIGFAGDGTVTVNNSGTVTYFTSFDTVNTANVNNSGSIGEGLVFNKTTTANVTNSGSITATNTPDVVGTTRDAVYSAAALNLTNTSTGSINGFVNGVRSDGASLTLDNAGTIRGNGTSINNRVADAAIQVTGGPASITNSGIISGAGFGITTGLYSDPTTNAASGRAIGSTVTNSGSIIGDTNDGIRLMGGGTVTNSGYIAGLVGAGADGVSMFSFVDQDLSSFSVIGSVTNSGTGLIEGNRFGIILSNGGIVNNAGTISGLSGSVLMQAGAVSADLPRNGTIANSGTLLGTVQFNNLANATVTNSGAISSLNGNGVFTTAPSGTLAVDNQAAGSIAGANSGIRSEGSSLSVTNAGTIRGNGTAATLRTADAGILVTGGPATIANTGTISGAGFGITTGLYSDPTTNAASGRAIGSTVTNSGSIIGDNNDGIRLMGGGTVTNSGTIAGHVGAGADGVSMFAYEDQDTTALPQIGTVNNLAGGTIEGFRFGIIQSGGGTINNAGTINGGTNGAILIQTGFIDGKTGSVANSGTINGSTSLFSLTSASVTNSGTMNGYVSFDTVGTASVLNSGSILEALGHWGVHSTGDLSLDNSGTISAPSTVEWDGAVGGVGVWTDGSADVTNSGTIFGYVVGLDAYGPASTIDNSGSILGTFEGVQLAGGFVSNSGHISGRDFGIVGSGTVSNLTGGLVDGNIAIELGGGGTVTNAGSLTSTNGTSAVVIFGVSGSPAGTVTNSGQITGTVNFSSNLAGATLNNSGSIIVTNNNPAVVTLEATTLVNSGRISSAGSNAVSLFGANTADTVTLLTGSSITGAVDGGTGTDTLRLSGTIATPTVQQTVGRFLNFENLNVLGGYWTAPGNTGTFTSTAINGGALAVNGTLTSPITVNAGAMLAGTGTITGALTANSGGTVAPGGSSIGTLNITGNVAFNAGSVFSVQTNPNGTSDKLAVTGGVTITKGATIQVLAGIFPNYAPAGTSYVVLTATGGINGKFDSPPITDYAYFKATVNVQQKGTVTVQITPNGKPLPSAASVTTFSTATAVDSLGTGSPLYQAVLYQSLTGARQAFSSLSGSSYSRLDALMTNDLGRVQLGFDGTESSAPKLEWTGLNSLAARGVESGSSTRRGPVSLMMVAGRYSTRLASAEIVGAVDTRFFSTAAAYGSGRFQALASVTSAWHDVSVARTIAFPGFSDHANAHYSANSDRVDLEGSYALGGRHIGIAPYGGYSRLMMRSHAFLESGGLSALSFDHESRAIDQLRVGMRARATFGVGKVTFSPHADVSLSRFWGDVAGPRGARFASGGDEFDSMGTGFDSRMVAIDAGMDVKAGPVTFAGSYRARLGDRWRDHSAMLSAGLRF